MWSITSSKQREQNCIQFGALDLLLSGLYNLNPSFKIPPSEMAFVKWCGKPYLVPSVLQGTVHALSGEQELLAVLYVREN